MKLLITLLLLTNIAWCVNPLDKIAPNDKQLHFMANYIATDIMQNGWKWSPWQSYIAVEVLSRVKENLDVACGGKWDNKDIIANRVGWATFNIIHIKFY